MRRSRLSDESYRTFLKAFKEMLEAIWQRDFQPTPDDPMEDYDWLWERELEHELAAEEKTLAESQAPRSKRLSPQDRLHMKYAREKPGLNEEAVSERMLRRNPEPCEAGPAEDLSALVQVATPETWRSACFLVRQALRDVDAFRSVAPTRAQRRILYAAAVALYSDVTEKAISEASGVSEKTLRQWLKLLSQYGGMIGRYERARDQANRDWMRRYLLTQGLTAEEGGKYL
jgi:hypothetical protein